MLRANGVFNLVIPSLLIVGISGVIGLPQDVLGINADSLIFIVSLPHYMHILFESIDQLAGFLNYFVELLVGFVSAL